MFDPEVSLDDRLRKELGLQPSQLYFRGKKPCNEEEIKFLTASPMTSNELIRREIQLSKNRIVDTRNWKANPYALVTLNLDTPDRDLAREGFSLRVRFAYNPYTNTPISNVDMCIKTTIPSNGRIFNQTRGEWEVELKTLSPDMNEMRRAHRYSNPPLPDFLMADFIKDQNLYVESVGLTMRNVFPSYEKFMRHGQSVVGVFQHTEDWLNQFMAPYMDGVLAEDSEVEAEFLGFINLQEKEADEATFEKLMRKSMGLLTKVITNSDPSNLTENPISKSMRARKAIASIGYNDSFNSQFDRDKTIDESIKYMLGLKIKPSEVDMSAISGQTAKLQRKVASMLGVREICPFQKVAS